MRGGGGGVIGPVVIDTDPGQDDAVAILLALATGMAVRAITAVAGNVAVARAAANAIRVCDLAGRADVPVHAGAAGPLVFPLETAAFVCGPDGLAGATLPPPGREAGAEHGALALVRLARAERLTVCALGPLTNIALAIRLAPDIAGRIERVAMMGGAPGLGNMTPAAEFNVYVDPHAASIVLGAGIPVAMFGLNVTHEAVPTADELAALAALGTRAGGVVHNWLTRPRPGGLGTAAHPLHDPCVIAWLLWPELFELRDCHVAVETAAGPLRGRTTIDWHGRLGLDANAAVAGSLDARALFARLTGALAALP